MALSSFEIDQLNRTRVIEAIKQSHLNPDVNKIINGLKTRLYGNEPVQIGSQIIDDGIIEWWIEPSDEHHQLGIFPKTRYAQPSLEPDHLRHIFLEDL